VNFYIPVYVACKIKSIQDVSAQTLTGNISCALIINVKYGDLPEEIVEKLEKGIIIQLNRGEAMQLADDGLNITFKRNYKAEFLTFTIRKVFLAFMVEDTLWSPFEQLDLIISITLNTVTIAADSLIAKPYKTGFNPKKEYKISFNCMRNSNPIPITYALDCVYGVYDLAERKLETYHTRFSSFKEVQKHHEECLQAKLAKGTDKKDKKSDKKKEENNDKKERREDREATVTILPPPSPKNG
jgi:hypothetical protein